MSSNGEFLLVSPAFVCDDEELANGTYTDIINELRDIFGTYGHKLNDTDLMIYPPENTRLDMDNETNGMPTLGHDRRHINNLLKIQGEQEWVYPCLIRMIHQMRTIRDICAKYDVDVFYMSEYEVVQDQQDLNAGIETGEIVELTEENIAKWESQIKPA